MSGSQTKYNRVLTTPTLLLPRYAYRSASEKNLLGGMTFVFGSDEHGQWRVFSFAAETYIKYLVTNCAYQIYMPHINMKMLGGDTKWSPNQLRACLPTSFKNKVKYTDRTNSVWNAVKLYLEPLYQCVERKSEREMESRLNDLARDTYMLILAAKKNCELNLSPSSILKNTQEIQMSFAKLSSEASARLSRIEGLFRLYSDRDKVSGFKLLPTAHSPSLLERADEIVSDAYLLQASQLRRFFGIGANRAAIKRDLAKLTKFITKNRRWAKGLIATSEQDVILSKSCGAALEGLLEIASSIEKDVSSPVLLPNITNAIGAAHKDGFAIAQIWKIPHGYTQVFSFTPTH